MTATITRDLPLADYLRLPGVHFSSLKWMDTSALHYHRAATEAKAPTPAMVLGSITHAAILTPGDPVGVAVYDGKRRAGKEWDAFEQANGHLAIVRRDELETSRAMRAAALANKHARALLSDGEAEVTIQWTEHGLNCRARVDWLRPNGLVEVKTTRSIHPRAFASECAKRAYHVQLALYYRALNAAGIAQEWLPHVIAVENVAPFDVAVYQVGFDTIEAGERKADEWLRAVAACVKADEWPGVGGGEVLELKLPNWALSDGLPDVDMDSIGEMVT